MNDLKREVQKRESAPPAKPQVLAMLDKQAPAIAAALPKFMDPDHFRRVLMTEIRRTPKLMQCHPMTVIGSCMLAAQLGLEPGPLGQCYLIPRNNRKTSQMECNFQWGYKGLLAMVHRSGEVADVTVEAVHEHDDFAVRLGDDPSIHHVPAKWGTDRGEAIGYYAVIRTQNGGTYRKTMGREEIEAHAKQFSESYGRGTSSPWSTNFDAMAKKTVLLQVMKLAPMSIDMHRKVETDGATRRSVDPDLVSFGDDDAQEVEATVVGDAGGEEQGDA